jgi:hypothetical protein
VKIYSIEARMAGLPGHRQFGFDTARISSILSIAGRIVSLAVAALFGVSSPGKRARTARGLHRRIRPNGRPCAPRRYRGTVGRRRGAPPKACRRPPKPVACALTARAKAGFRCRVTLVATMSKSPQAVWPRAFLTADRRDGAHACPVAPAGRRDFGVRHAQQLPSW